MNGFPLRTARSHSPGRRFCLVLTLLACLLAGGCSVMGAVYARLDLLLTLEADRWLDLERGQKARLRAALAASLERHRQEELRAWIALLQRVAGHFEGHPDAAEILGTIEESRQLMERSTALVLEPLAHTLAALEPRQVEHLARELEEDNAEYRDEFLDPSPRRREALRVERVQDAVERWSGRLGDEQEAVIGRFMAEIPDGAEAWQDYRLAWQRSLLAQLRAGTDAAGFSRLLTQWWIGDAGMDPAYSAQLARNRQTIASGMADLIARLTPAQRSRAAERLRDAAEDLEAIADGDG